ncbi:zinc finger CCCH domain-containing protein 18 isoform X2 [Drosophila ficusphila]|uniref:zinc finger CCCH domain-containing protein 18 isoform X2 n=1 Tax=Drosophila ficusphila TaxID=30025 RepID=UPI0007E6F69D|nr:zinc finger CCCH domain-containing protein 18 isoform X2 [Drosophila ficusphila]
MVIDMESDDSRASSPSNSSESRSNSPTNDKEEVAADQAEESVGGGATMDRSVRAASTSSSSSNSSSSSSRSELSKKQKKSSSSSSGSGSGSSSSSGSSSEDEPDQEQDRQEQPSEQQQHLQQHHQQQQLHRNEPEPEPEADRESPAAVTESAESVEQPGSPSAKSQPSSFLSSVRSRSNSPQQQLYNQAAVDLNISHEDLSDVSDIEAEEKQAPAKNSSLHPADEDEDGAISNDSLPGLGEEDELRRQQQEVKQNGRTTSGDEEKASAKETKPDEASNGRVPASAMEEDLVKTHDDDALDFEAEEGECPEPVKEKPSESKANETNLAKGTAKKAQDDDDDEDDGEVDGDEDDDSMDKEKRKDNGNGSLEEGEEGKDAKDKTAAAAAALSKRKKDEEELEEGEVSDEDEKRPEETEPKPVCRFYTRGQCTWGMSCRFLHPGVTDKGNYTMFESLVRSVPIQGGSAGAGASGAGSSAAAAARAGAGGAYGSHAAAAAVGGDYHDYRNERPPLHHRPALLHAPSIYGGHVHDSRPLLPDGPVVVENAWERGLRTAKEMMRKANKRKEQDMDFEDKKMNLTLSPDEMEKDPYYLKDRGGSSARSPPPPSTSAREQPLNPLSLPPLPMHPHAVPHASPRSLLPLQYSVYGPPPDRYGRQYMPPQYEDVDAYGRMARYRELPPHRMPHYEDDRRLRPAREVIVQRVEAAGRGDEWSDPWMRSKSMGRGSYDRDDRRRRDRRSYSSNSSYSTSNSSQSDSSSDSSRSSSPSEHKRRYGGSGSGHKLAAASASSRRHAGRTARSPSQIPRRPRHSSKGSLSPSYKRPALEKRGGVGHSPASKRKKLSSPAPKKFDKLRRRRSSSSSDSDSSDTSYSESESGSSSSDSSSGSRDTPQKRVRATDKALNERKLIKKPAEQATKKRSPISIEIKKTSNMVGVSALASPNNSADSDKEKEHGNGNGKDKEKDHSKDKDKDIKEKDHSKDKEKDGGGGKDKDGKKSRREELLKQLRAVEDAIAKKRSKLN